jgi:chorismate synthase
LEEDVDRDLARRQKGYGRGGRQKIERDRARFLSGVRLGRSTGSPIAILVENADHASWKTTMSPSPGIGDPGHVVRVPRPGHADLAGAAKHGLVDMRDVLERSSARETVGRVAAGAVARRLLLQAGVTVAGRLISLGGVLVERQADPLDPQSVDWEAVEASEFACEDTAVEERLRELVDDARQRGESLGGVFEVWAWGLVPGLGGYAEIADRLDGRLFGALAGIPAIKAVEVGLGFRAALLPGSQVHDPIVLPPAGGRGLRRASNNAGGLEGGMTNGEPVILRAAMKPIPTMTAPLPSVDLTTHDQVSAHKERSDVEAVAAARVVGEAMVSLVLADAYLEKLGGDSLQEFEASLERYRVGLVERGIWAG